MYGMDVEIMSESIPVFYYKGDPCFTFGQVAHEMGVPAQTMYKGMNLLAHCEMIYAKRHGNVFCEGLESVGDFWPSYCVPVGSLHKIDGEIKEMFLKLSFGKGRPRTGLKKRLQWANKKSFFSARMREFLFRFCEFDCEFFMSTSLLADAFFSWVSYDAADHYFCGDSLAHVEHILSELRVPFSGRNSGNLVHGIAFANEVSPRFYSIDFERPSLDKARGSRKIFNSQNQDEGLYFEKDLQL